MPPPSRSPAALAALAFDTDMGFFDMEMLQAVTQDRGEGEQSVLAVVDEVKKRGAHIDLNKPADTVGNTPLIFAAHQGHATAAAALLAVTGDKHVVAVEPNLMDKYGNTALIVAACKGHRDTVCALVDAVGEDGRHHVDLNVPEKDGDTALIVAAGNGRSKSHLSNR